MTFAVMRLLFVAIGVSLVIGARPAVGQEEISREGYPCGKYSGDLAVFGRLTVNRPGVQLELAQVKLTRSDNTSEAVFADKEGKYCIQYKPGLDIATLSFEDGDIACVSQISGKSSHYINKVLDNSCAPVRASATAFNTRTAATVFTSAVAKRFVVLQAIVSNTSGGTLQIASYQLEHETSAQTQSAKAVDVITPYDPDIVALLAAHQKSSVCVLCIGPVNLIQIPIHAHANDAEAYIRSHALRVNDIIPDGQSAMKLVFVDKSIMAKDPTHPDAIGTLVIRATKWTKSGDSRVSTAVGSENFGTVTVVAKIN